LKVSGRVYYCNSGCHAASLKTERDNTRIIRSKEDQPVKKRKKGLSFDELNRRAEYKRLYDDFHIPRQINGKARELI
jgi:hypothetical protein